MKAFRFAKAALAFGVVAACFLGLAACSQQSGSTSGVAATVNGTEISEQKVTDMILQVRENAGLTDDDQWGQFLVEQDTTPSDLRSDYIDSLISNELISQGAQELGITIEDSEIDEYVNKTREQFDSDEAWQSALEQAQLTEDEYRESIKESLYEQKVGDHFEDEAEPSDEDYVSSAQTYVSYYDGAKRSSHILFSVDDTSDEDAMAEARTQAQEVLDQINAGTLDFAEAAKQYSGDSESAEKGGDVGWDVLNSFVTEYTNALDELELNQVSDLVESEYGIHIIKCTDVFNAPEDTSTITSLDQLPSEFQDAIKEMAGSVKANEAYEQWLDDLKEKADKVINDMPSGLPYDIDLAPYQEAAEEESEDTDADADTDTDADTDVDTDADVDAEDAETIDVDAESSDAEVAAEGEESVAVETEESVESSEASESSSSAETGTAGSSGNAAE